MKYRKKKKQVKKRQFRATADSVMGFWYVIHKLDLWDGCTHSTEWWTSYVGYHYGEDK
jgi:hypothetical protein